VSAPPLLRIVGPPGSGKSLLITSLLEAFRQRGRRVASTTTRLAVTGPEGATVFALPNGGRVTASRILNAREQIEVATSMDPNLDLLLAEGLEEAGVPAVELTLSADGVPATAADDLLAVVTSEQVTGDFAVRGPGETHGLADLIEQRLLGVVPPPPTPAADAPHRGLFGRFRRR
jgi:molybdopterin-guanine dinucleotide biosynthesis protein